jgi:hypothetical protein
MAQEVLLGFHSAIMVFGKLVQFNEEGTDQLLT